MSMFKVHYKKYQSDSAPRVLFVVATSWAKAIEGANKYMKANYCHGVTSMDLWTDPVVVSR